MGTISGTFSLVNDKLTVTLNTADTPEKIFRVIYKDNKLYVTSYATNDEIKDAYDLYGSHFTSVEDFIKDNCDAVYQKQ